MWLRTGLGVALALALGAGCGTTSRSSDVGLRGAPPPALAGAVAHARGPRRAHVARAPDPPTLYLRCADPAGCPPSVGMLVFAGEPEPERCTASLVAPDRVLTASHCLPPDARHAGAACAGAWVVFADAHGARDEWVACRRVLDAADVDDTRALRPEHAVLQLERALARPPLEVDARPAAPGSIVTVVSVTPHPIYGSSHDLSSRLCRVEDAEPAVEALGPAARRVGWLSSCAIERGNSGSPVLDHDGRLRAIVHGGTDTAFAYGVTSALPARAEPPP